MKVIPTETVVELERARLNGIVERQGIDAAIAFAKQTRKTYRQSVLWCVRRGKKNSHYASSGEYRRRFIISYLVFKDFLKREASRLRT